MNRKELLDQYFNPDNKLNQTQFSKHYGISQQTFNTWINEDPRYTRKYTEQQKEQFLDQYFNPDNQLNQKQFSKHYGISRKTFNNWIKKDARYTRKYTEQQKEQFLDQYFNPDNQLNQTQFSKHYGISQQTFNTWINEDPRYTRKYTEQQKEQFLDQYFNPDNQLNQKQFAEQHGILQQTFNKWLKKDSKNKNTNEPQPGTSRDSTGAFPNQIHEAPTLFHTPTFDDVVKAMEEPMINFSQTISKEEKSPSKMKVKISYATEKSKQSNLSKQASTSRDHPYR